MRHKRSESARQHSRYLKAINKNSMFESHKNTTVECCHFVPSSLYQWDHEHDRHVWQKYQIRYECACTHTHAHTHTHTHTHTTRARAHTVLCDLMMYLLFSPSQRSCTEGPEGEESLQDACCGHVQKTCQDHPQTAAKGTNQRLTYPPKRR